MNQGPLPLFPMAVQTGQSHPTARLEIVSIQWHDQVVTFVLSK